MNQIRFVMALIVVCLACAHAFAQAEDLPKFEIAAEFTTLERERFNQRRTEPGVGARFTFNLNESVALEAASYFFPKRCFECANGGRIVQAVGGVKVGKRFEKWGAFLKARPGFVTFTQGERNWVASGSIPEFPFEQRFNSETSFAADLGGVVEFYPSRRIVTRFDFGDTLIHFTRRTTNDIFFDPVNGFTIGPVTRPARTAHNFQFMASVGFRF